MKRHRGCSDGFTFVGWSHSTGAFARFEGLCCGGEGGDEERSVEEGSERSSQV